MTDAIEPIAQIGNVVQHFALSDCQPYVDHSVGRFGAIVLLLDDDKSGVIVAYLPAGRIIDKRHADYLISQWKKRTHLKPLNVFDTARALEIIEGTLHQGETVDTQAEDDCFVSGRQVKNLMQETSLNAFQREQIDHINSIIAKHLDIDDPVHILPELHLRDDLGADSLDTFELALAVEDELHTTLDEDSVSNWQTVQDVYNTVRAAQ